MALWESQAARESVAVCKAIGAQHWRVWEWLNGHIDRHLSMRPVHRPSSLLDLWNKAFQGQLQEGDYIEFRPNQAEGTYWHLHEWVPKAPGQIWAQDNLRDLSPDDISSLIRSDIPTPDKLGAIQWAYGPHAHWIGRFEGPRGRGISLQDQGFNYRLGCIRPAVSNDPNKHALLAVCTATEYMADLSFPVLVSKEVYLKFIRTRSNDRTSVEFDGRARVGQMAWSEPFSRYLEASGATSDSTIASMIASPVGAYPLVGEVLSPLDIDFCVHDSHPAVTLRVDGWNTHPATRAKGVLLVSRYSVVNPADKFLDKWERDDGTIRDDLRYSLTFLTGEEPQSSTIMVPITDFDGRVRRIQAQAWIGVNPASDEAVLENICDPLVQEDKHKEGSSS